MMPLEDIWCIPTLCPNREEPGANSDPSLAEWIVVPWEPAFLPSP